MNKIEFSEPTEVIVKNTALRKAAAIYKYTHISGSSLLEFFNASKRKRGNPRGVLTDQEQDLLRAILVIVCAGLDAMLKQAIRDSIMALVKKDAKVQSYLEDFIQRRVSGNAETLDAPSGARFLGRILASESPQAKVIEEFIKDLTGDSLQSAEQVLKTVDALGFDHKQLSLDPKELKTIFRVRNKIIHELDINLEGRRRKRTVRGQDEMLGYTNTILRTGRAIIEALDKRL